MITIQHKNLRGRGRCARVSGALGLASLLCGAHAAQAQSSHLKAVSVGGGWSSVIATIDGSDLTPAQAGQVKALGADIYRHLSIIHSVAVRVPTRNLKALAALPFLKHVSPDLHVGKSDEFTVGSSEADQALGKYDLTGRGITVAVIDSGVQNVPDLKGRLVANVSLVPQDVSPRDGCGHGTHVAGIIAGDGTSSTGRRYFRTFYGIARAAQIANVRVLDDQGQGDVSSVVAGLQWTIDHKARYNIRVINLSLGHPVGESYTTDPLCQAVEAAWKAGIVVVCAAGNNGRLQNTSPTPDPALDNSGYGTAYGTIDSPGNDPAVITVGAMKSADGTRADDLIASYSSRGPSRLDLVLKPDIVAPGNKVISTLAKNSYLETAYGGSNEIPLSLYAKTKDEDKNSNRYFQLSGTSMSTPVVAGAALLLLQQDPKLSPDTIKARLMATADKWTGGQNTPDCCTYGAGYLNIMSALRSSLIASHSAASPKLVRDADGNVGINTDGLVWGDTGLWGTGVQDLRFIWGNSIAGDGQTGADRFIWGNNILTGSRFIWGNSVWSDRFIWGNSSSAVDLSSTAINGEN